MNPLVLTPGQAGYLALTLRRDDRAWPIPASAAVSIRLLSAQNPTGVLRLGAEADPLVQALLAPVRALLERSADLEAFRDGLLGLYPDLDPAPFAALMAQALAVADAAGRGMMGKWIRFSGVDAETLELPDLLG